MKFATVSKSVVLGLALLLSSGAFATTKGSLQINHSVTVNGTQLKAGEYKVQWEGTGPNVELSIMQGSKVFAKVPAHIIELDAPAISNATLTRDGGASLTGLRFQGKKFGLELGEASDGMQGGSSK